MAVVARQGKHERAAFFNRNKRMPLVCTDAKESKILASDAATNDYFGVSASISGNYCVAGATGKVSSTGAAYVYYRTGNNIWNTEAKLVASDAATGDQFGKSVCVSGDYIIIGSIFQNTGGTEAGAAYIFHRTGTNTWDAGTKIVSSDIQAGDRFGISVSINGDYVISGAYGEDAGGSNAGAAYIYHRNCI